MGEQMFTMRSEVDGRPFGLSDDLDQSFDQKKKTVKDGVPQFQNFHVNIHKMHALFSTRLSHRLGNHHKFDNEVLRKNMYLNL
jgi:hypothetical protein